MFVSWTLSSDLHCSAVQVHSEGPSSRGLGWALSRPPSPAHLQSSREPWGLARTSPVGPHNPCLGTGWLRSARAPRSLLRKPHCAQYPRGPRLCLGEGRFGHLCLCGSPSCSHTCHRGEMELLEMFAGTREQIQKLPTPHSSLAGAGSHQKPPNLELLYGWSYKAVLGLRKIPGPCFGSCLEFSSCGVSRFYKGDDRSPGHFLFLSPLAFLPRGSFMSIPLSYLPPLGKQLRECSSLGDSKSRDVALGERSQPRGQ